MTEDQLDRRLQALGAAEPRLSITKRAAILARVLDEPAAPVSARFVPAVYQDASRPQSLRRLAGIALGLGAAAAMVVLVFWLWPASDDQQLPSMTVIDAGSPVGPHTVPPPAHVVHPNELELDRIAGNKKIEPDDDTKARMARDGKHRLIGSVKLCVDMHGHVDKLAVLKPTGYPAYDAKIVAGMSGWLYRARADEVCTAVTFIYEQ